MNPVEDPLQARMGQKMTCGQGTTKRGNTCLDWEPNRERSTRGKSLAQALSREVKDVRDLIKVRRNILYRDTRQSSTNLVKPVNGILNETFDFWFLDLGTGRKRQRAEMSRGIEEAAGVEAVQHAETRRDDESQVEEAGK